MEWDPWFIKDHIGLAKYVHPEIARWFPLKVNRLDLIGFPNEGRRQLINTIYDTLLEKKISYDPPLYNSSSKQQIIRNPNEILDGNQKGTCLDLVVLFSSLCFGYDLLPVIICIKGHALVAVSLECWRNESVYRSERSLFKDEPLTDPDKFRTFINLIDQGAYLAIECTGFASSKYLSEMQDEHKPESIGRVNEVLPFDQAIWAGRKQLDQTSRPFEFAIDIAFAHDDWGLALQPLFPNTLDDLFNLGVDSVKLADISPASDQDVEGYYEGNPLSWEILVAQGDVERDISNKLIQSLTSSINRVTMLCLCGEPGAGKSTLAWRVAAEVARLRNWPLLHILNNESVIWYQLRHFAQKRKIPLVVLVDDVFRNRDIQQALASIGSGQDICIIATSRSDELPENARLPFLQVQTLDEPSPSEKRRVLQKLGVDENSLGAPQRARLRNANSWLILMSEVSIGEEWKKIVKDSIIRLKEQDSDKTIYRAYEYLCYAGQYELDVPKTLIEAIDEDGYFYNLLEHPMSKGFIFRGNKIQDSLRTRHPIFAREALRSYRRDPLAILNDFVDTIKPNQLEHRVFFCHLIRSSLTLDRQESVVPKLLEQKVALIDIICNS